jgi:hypothetical protein
MRLALAFLLFSLPAYSQASKGTSQEELELRREHVPWPSPESVERDLRSNDDAVRLKALELLGVSHPRYEASDHSMIVIGPPEGLEIRYASLGTDNEQQAIVAADLGAMFYGAVVTLKGNRWERIAAFSCWCKYERGDVLGSFLQIQLGSQGDELVVHTSGGGTGIYEQYEGRFRLYRGELRSVFHFVSRYQECPAAMEKPVPCNLQRRWFVDSGLTDVEVFVLIEARASVFADKVPDLIFEEQDLQIRYTGPITCKAYKWDESKFRYVSISMPASNPCKPSPPTE